MLVLFFVLSAAAGCVVQPEGTSSQEIGAASPAKIGSDGLFYLNGLKTTVFAAEEERRVLSNAEVDQLIPRLQEMGVNALVIYYQNLQSDYFYQQMESHGIWIAQHLGSVKKRLVGFSATGGEIGTIPDEAWIQMNLSQINTAVTRLAPRNNILFWWLGGEFAESEFHTSSGMTAVRDSVRRYRDAIAAIDTRMRPYTVSHHFVEAIEDPTLPFIDYSDLTDFSWFTVATHFHLNDFISIGGWWPVAQVTEPALILKPLMQRAYSLAHSKPIFFGGWYGQAPFWGACAADAQLGLMHDKWDAIQSIPHLGSSIYHLDAWDNNAIPHALFQRTSNDWIPTLAGRALREIIQTSALHNAVAVTGVSGGSGTEVRYTLEVPPGATNLSFSISGGTGDADLYVRFGGTPTTTTYDCRPRLAGNAETCSFTNPAIGTWHVMVRGYSSFSGVSLLGKHNVGTLVQSGARKTDLAGSAGTELRFKIDVPAGATGLKIAMSGGTGDADLYAKLGSAPTTSAYDCRPYLTTNDETCNFTNPAAGTWHFMVRGYTSFSGVSVVATHNVGLSEQNLSGAQNDERQFTMIVPKNTASITFTLSGGTFDGDADLYVRKAGIPTTTTYDCAPRQRVFYPVPGYSETCTVANPPDGTWYVMVRGYTSFSSTKLVGNYPAP